MQAAALRDPLIRDLATPRPIALPSIDVVRGDTRLIDDIAEEWGSLCDEGPCIEPFYRPEWISTYLKAMEPNARLLLVTARRGRRLRAVFPLIEERITFSGMRITRLRATTSLKSPDRIDLVHGDGDRSAVVGAIWSSLQNTSGWDLLDLVDTHESGAIHELVSLAQAERNPTAVRHSRETPYVPLPGPGGSFEQAIAHTGTKFRANVRRRMRNLEKIGEVRLVRHEHADRDFLDRFFTMEAAGWKGEQGTALDRNPKQRAFYEALAREAEKHGYLSLYALECAGEPVAMHFGLTIGGRYLVPKLTYDETRHEFAPGHLLVQEVIRDSVARGLTEFDFLGSSAPWKMEWAPAVRTFHHCWVFNRGVTGRSAHALRFRLMPAGRRVSNDVATVSARIFGFI